MSENKKQTELEQLIKVELLGIITRIAELAAKNIIDANQQEFINSLKSVINHQIAFAWEVTKLLNDLDKKTPQDARDQGKFIDTKIDTVSLRNVDINEVAKEIHHDLLEKMQRCRHSAR